MKHPTLHLRLLLATVLALAGGCAGTPPARFHTLSPVAEAAPAAAAAAYSVAIGPVSVPDTVDRPQLVLQLDANRVEILEQTRWAAPLQSAIGQVIAANLTRLLGGARVAAYPQRAAAEPDYEVTVDVLRFESTLGSAASLDVLWSIRGAKGRVLKAGRSTVREPAEAQDTDSLVAAHDRALAAVSRDIARFISGISASSGGR